MPHEMIHCAVCLESEGGCLCWCPRCEREPVFDVRLGAEHLWIECPNCRCEECGEPIGGRETLCKTCLDAESDSPAYGSAQWALNTYGLRAGVDYPAGL